MGRKKPSKTLQRAAVQAQQDAMKSQREAMQSQENMRVNFAQNLANENVASIIVGGTADLTVDQDGMRRQRKRGGSGLSSTLGVSA